MEVRNCRSCGRLFNYIGGKPICKECQDALEEKFSQVKEYVRDNPAKSIQEIADANEVTTQQIYQWVREERLEFGKDSLIGIECENCGTTIKTGRFCDACKAKMVNGLTNAFKREEPKPEPEKKSTGSKMRFI